MRREAAGRRGVRRVLVSASLVLGLVVTSSCALLDRVTGSTIDTSLAIPHQAVLAENPFTRGQPVFVSTQSRAAKAAEKLRADRGPHDHAAQIVARISEFPTAFWLLPEVQGPGSVKGKIAKVVNESLKEPKLSIWAIYGIPQRDCSQYSAGGLEPDKYVAWVKEIADALQYGLSIVVMEPDALPLSAECGDQAQRLDLIAQGVKALHDAGVTVYIDIGHAGWLSPGVAADLLKRAGVQYARGFAVNVSNYRSVTEAARYSETVVTALGGSHGYVIDTSRNGRPTNDEQWCNVRGMAMGLTPAAAADGRHDANIWIKPPGESDGECNGGPRAGECWTEYALELAVSAGW